LSAFLSVISYTLPTLAIDNNKICYQSNLCLKQPIVTQEDIVI